MIGLALFGAIALSTWLAAVVMCFLKGRRSLGWVAIGSAIVPFLAAILSGYLIAIFFCEEGYSQACGLGVALYASEVLILGGAAALLVGIYVVVVAFGSRAKPDSWWEHRYGTESPGRSPSGSDRNEAEPLQKPDQSPVDRFLHGDSPP